MDDEATAEPSTVPQVGRAEPPAAELDVADKAAALSHQEGKAQLWEETSQDVSTVNVQASAPTAATGVSGATGGDEMPQVASPDAALNAPANAQEAAEAKTTPSSPSAPLMEAPPPQPVSDSPPAPFVPLGGEPRPTSWRAQETRSDAANPAIPEAPSFSAEQPPATASLEEARQVSAQTEVQSAAPPDLPAPSLVVQSDAAVEAPALSAQNDALAEEPAFLVGTREDDKAADGWKHLADAPSPSPQPPVIDPVLGPSGSVTPVTLREASVPALDDLAPPLPPPDETSPDKVEAVAPAEPPPLLGSDGDLKDDRPDEVALNVDLRPPPIQTDISKESSSPDKSGNMPSPERVATPKSDRSKAILDEALEWSDKSALSRGLVLYTTRIVRCPCCFIVLYFLLTCAVIAIFWREFDVDTDFSSFIRADGDAMRRREAYILALEEKKGISGSRRLDDQTGQDARTRKSDDNEPFTKEEWWKAMRRYEDERIQHEDFIDREHGEIRIDESLMFSSEEDFQRRLNDGLDEVLFSSSEREHDERYVNSTASTETNDRRLQSNYFFRKTFSVIYEAVSGNALSDRVLRDIQEFEQRLFRLPGWQMYCGQHVTDVSKRLCNPGESLAAYAWPSQQPSVYDYQVYKLNFDAKGRTLLDQSVMLSYLQTSAEPVHSMDRFFPKDFSLPPLIGNATKTYIPPKAVRTTFTFKLVVGQKGTSMVKVKQAMEVMKEGFDAFLEDEIYPVLSKAEFDNTKVWYYGFELSAYEVTKTLYDDAKFAAGSIVFVLFYMLFHTRSLLVSCSSLGMIFFSIPVAYVLTPASKTTIASFLSLFLITGVGSDVIFVFTDFWDQSARLQKPIEIRLAWMIMHAGTSCFATSLTTAVSFFANLASVLQPLREFGMFMGLCVMSAFLLVLLFLPSIIIIRQRRIDKRRAVHPIGEVEPELRQTEVLKVLALPPIPDEENPPEKIGRSASKGSGSGNSSNGSNESYLARTSYIQRFLIWITGRVAHRPVKILVFTGILVIVFIIGVSAKAELEKGVPKIFPEDHNQVQAEKWEGEFFTVDMPKFANLGYAGSACTPNRSVSTEPVHMEDECNFYWCEADSAEIQGSADGTTGYCWRSPQVVTAFVGPAEHADIAWTLQDPFSENECNRILIRTRLAGPVMPRFSDWSRMWVPVVDDLFKPAPNSNKSGVVIGPDESQWVQRITFEQWETGKVELSNYWNLGYAIVYPGNFNSSGTQVVERLCEMETLCSFGAPKCNLHGWQKIPTELRLSEAPVQPPRMQNSFGRRLDDSERRLALVQPNLYKGAVLPLNKQSDVTVLWGIRHPSSTPLVGAPESYWEFDPSFEPENPWAQRAMYNACIDFPKELLVIKTDCWVDKFKDWLGSSGDRFPTRKFDERILEWFVAPSGVIQAGLHIWLVNRKVKATKIAFLTNFNQYAGAQEAIKYVELWNEHMENLNRESSVSANHAYATAQNFVRAEAEIAVINSTVETIIISALCGWLGMLVFTKDPWAAGLVTLLVLGIICGLAFFIVVVCDWKIGPIEVISLVVFVGYSVTYSLHIAHNFCEVSGTDEVALALEVDFLARERRRQERKGIEDPELPPWLNPDGTIVEDLSKVQFTERQRRRARTRMAILHVGGATMSSAMSTVGSSMFLLFCTLNIFVKLGSVVIAVTFLSIVFSLLPLPALLMTVGPSDESGLARYMRYFSFLDQSARRTYASYRGHESLPADEDTKEPLVPGREVAPQLLS
jgi:predicted RND superfamily exporter protein